MKKVIMRWFYGLVALMLFSFELFCQVSIENGIGIGFPECFNLNIKIGYNQFQVGGNYGFIPNMNDAKIKATGAFCQYHIAKESRSRNRKHLYIKAGYDFLLLEDEYDIDKYNYFDARIGYDFHFGSKAGLNLDFGFIQLLSHKHTEKKVYVPTGLSVDLFPNVPVWDFNNMALMPCIGVKIYILKGD